MYRVHSFRPHTGIFGKHVEDFQTWLVEKYLARHDPQFQQVSYVDLNSRFGHSSAQLGGRAPAYLAPSERGQIDSGRSGTDSDSNPRICASLR